MLYKLKWIFIAAIVMIFSSSCFALRADINGDGRVDLQDFIILSEEWLMGNSFAQFNGTDGYITVPSDAALNLGTGDFTICGWVNTAYDSIKYILNKYGSGVGYYVRYNSVSKNMELYTKGASSGNATFPIADNTIGFHHIVFVKSDSSVYAYFDGVSQVVTGSATTSNIDSTATLNLGKLAATNFLGSIDDLRIYKSALTPEQIAVIYAGGRGTKYAPGQLTVEPSFVMEFDAPFAGAGSDETYSTIPSETPLIGTKSGGVTIESGGVPFWTGKQRIIYLADGTSAIIRRQGCSKF